MNNLLRHLRIADLELFVTAMHLNNISKAAAIHNLSQSAASSAIQRVELAFGKALCLHEKRQFRLTYEGTILIPKIEEWLKHFKESIVTNLERPIRMATTNAIARVIMPVILPLDSVDLQLMRPDYAYAAVLKDNADIAIVPDNALWKDVVSREIGFGYFGLYASKQNIPLAPVLLPENQIEVLTFMRRWEQMHNKPIEIKSRIPSWSLIADLCANSEDVGFLPNFLARRVGLHLVDWQPAAPRFRMLALYNLSDDSFQNRLNRLLELCNEIFCL